MFPTIFTLNSNLFTHSLTRRLARSAAALLAVLSLSAGIASADQNNYLPARDEGAGWNSRPATRDLDDADSLPPHRGGGYRSNYRLDDRRFEDRPVRSDRRFDDRSPDLNGDWTPDLGNGSSRTRQNWDRTDSNRFDGNRFDSNRFDSGRDFAPQFNGRTNRPSDSDLDTFGAPNRPFSDRSRFEELPAPATIPGDRSWRDRTQPLNSLPFNNGGRNDLPFNNNWGPDLRDQLPQVAPRKKVDERPQPVELINRRYSDPAVIGFISQLDAQRGLQLYSEVLDLIQNRHLEPQSPAALVQRAQAAGYAYGRIGENLAHGQRSLAQALAGWTASESHCVNLYDSRVTEMGLACVQGRDGRPFWAMLTGRPSMPPPPSLRSPPAASAPAQ